MSDALAPYGSALLALGGIGLLQLLQLLVADVAGIRAGHTPGTPIPASHDDFLFRAARAHANSVESIGALILIAAFAIGRGADPSGVAICAWTLLGLRVAHGLAYYLDWRTPRSIAFALYAVALLALFVVGVRT